MRYVVQLLQLSLRKGKAMDRIEVDARFERLIEELGDNTLVNEFWGYLSTDQLEDFILYQERMYDIQPDDEDEEEDW